MLFFTCFFIGRDDLTGGSFAWVKKGATISFFCKIKGWFGGFTEKVSHGIKEKRV